MGVVGGECDGLFGGGNGVDGMVSIRGYRRRVVVYNHSHELRQVNRVTTAVTAPDIRPGCNGLHHDSSMMHLRPKSCLLSL